MSVITVAPAKPLITGGLTAAAVAAAATATVAAAGEFAGISLVVGGAPIPVFGFAVLTVIFSVVGLVLALVLARPAPPPRPGVRPPPLLLPPVSLGPRWVPDAS